MNSTAACTVPWPEKNNNNLLRSPGVFDQEPLPNAGNRCGYIAKHGEEEKD